MIDARTRLFDNLALLVSAWSLALLIGCTNTTPSEPLPSSRDEAEQTFTAFVGHLRAGKPGKALKLIAMIEKAPKRAVENERRRLAGLASQMKEGQWNISFVDIRVEGIGAVVIANEDIKHGRPSFDLDPLYLVRLENRWRIAPGLNRYRSLLRELREEDYVVFLRLQKWFEVRAVEIEKVHRAKEAKKAPEE